MKMSPLPYDIAATAKSLQSCLNLCDPIDGGPPGSPSLGFSRQERWSGLPFPSPVHERSWHLVPSLHGKQIGKLGTVTDFIFLGSKITADGDCSHEIKRHLLLGRKAMTSLLLLLLSHFSCVQLCVTP